MTATRPDICIYHGACYDGFTAAWAVYRKWPKIEFCAATHGNPPPDVTGKHVLIVDFSYSRATLENMLSTAASITILDHHKTAQEALEGLIEEGLIQGEFDMKRSGARMAWEYIWPADVVNPFDTQSVGDYDTENDKWVMTGPTGYVPWIVRFVEDRDLWLWQYGDETREALAYMQMFQFDFETWDILASDLEDETRFNTILEIGKALTKKQEADTLTNIRASQRRMTIAGYSVPVANLPYIMASDAGNIMCRGEPFAATYFDNSNGDRVFSLRSDNQDETAIDVSAIAKKYGGGGHFHASGFKAPKPGWEGEKVFRLDDIHEGVPQDSFSGAQVINLRPPTGTSVPVDA